MYFHTDRATDVAYIADMAALAKRRDGHLRISIDADGTLKFKAGEGIWSAPIYSTPDPYRDNS